jgi:hypothetical protein
MSLFDLSSFVGTLSPDTATVTRYNTSFATTGKANAKTVASTTTGKVSAQPQGQKWGRDLEGFSETENRFTLFAQIELRNGDRVTISGQAYEVEHVEPWNVLGNYWEATAKALDGTET